MRLCNLVYTGIYRAWVYVRIVVCIRVPSRVCFCFLQMTLLTRSMACTLQVVFLQARINSFRRALFSAQCIKNVSISHTRGYAKKHTQTMEELQTYNKFKRSLRSSRMVFQNELKAQQVSMEDFSAKAAEEARLEKEVEERALEANKIELERMARKRLIFLIRAQHEDHRNPQH